MRAIGTHARCHGRKRHRARKSVFCAKDCRGLRCEQIQMTLGAAQGKEERTDVKDGVASDWKSVYVVNLFAFKVRGDFLTCVSKLM